MEETPNSSPGEVAQFRNFVNSRLEMKRMEQPPGKGLSVLLSGLQTIIPNEVRETGIMQNPDHLATVQNMLTYQIRINDRIDFEGVGRSDIADLIDTTRAREEEAKNKFETTLSKLPDVQRADIENVTQTTINEITYVENWIRQKRDAKEITFKDVDTYRQLVNAISTVGDLAAIFGSDKFPGNLIHNPDTASVQNIQDVIDKYAWMFGNNPNSNLERTAMIAFHLAMDGQISDDWQDRRIDLKMHVPSYGVFAMRMHGGDRYYANKFLKNLRAQHRNQARELGLGRLPTKAVSTFLSWAMVVKRHGTNNAGKFGLMDRLPLRERAYAQGRFD